MLVRLGAEAGTPQADRRLEEVRSRIADGDVAKIGAPEPGRPSPLVSEDRRSVYLPVTFYTAADEDAAADALVARLRGERGVTVGGGVVAFNQVGDQVEADLQRAELLAAPILLLLSLLVFRSLVAALLPLVVGTATVLLTFSGLRLVNEFEPMSMFAINLTTGARARPRDRLLAVHGLALPRGARRRRGPLAGDPRDRAHRRAGRSCSPPSPWPPRWRRCSSSTCASCTRWAPAACSWRSAPRSSP